ncbi:MAG: iron-containing alcohol dehydrogenase [Paludibacteraceae bacterium]|nr:iron-containing alcohol dehydrogenase [Paludibacteraceae bacterium]
MKNADSIPVTFGKGVASELAKPIEEAGYKSVFIACSRTINRENMLHELIEKLNEKGIKTTVFTNIVPDPTIQNVEEGLSVLKANNCDCVVAAGGGSVIDCAKVIALRATNSWMPVSAMAFYIRPLVKSIPLYVLPSTSGTGSEVTYFSVITDEKKHKKCAIATDKFMPRHIVFDYNLLHTVPANPTVYAGLDALTHSVEAFISKLKPAFKEDAKSAPEVCRDIFKYLPVVKDEPDNEEARLAMAKAAYNAGINFRRNAVGFVHAIAHRIGENYHIPHGLACGVILPHVLRASLKDARADLDFLAKNSGIADNAEGFIKAIDQLLADLGVQTQFADIKKEDYPQIVSRVKWEAIMQGCPTWLGKKEIEEILNHIKG